MLFSYIQTPDCCMDFYKEENAKCLKILKNAFVTFQINVQLICFCQSVTTKPIICHCSFNVLKKRKKTNTFPNILELGKYQ